MLSRPKLRGLYEQRGSELAKSFSFTETVRMEFQTEVFNSFNRPQVELSRHKP